MSKISNIVDNIQNEWLGKSIFWSRKYGAQCTSVIKLYFKELGIKETPTGHAYQYIDHPYFKKYFDKVVNPQRDIKKGDVVVIDRLVVKDKNGNNISSIPYGHIAICNGVRTSTQLPSPNADKTVASSVWLLEQDGSITDRNFDDQSKWAKLEIGSRNLKTIAQVWRPNLDKINPKTTPTELIDKLSEPTKIPVRELEPVDTSGVIVDDAPVLKVIDEFKDAEVDTSEIEVPVELLTDNKEKQEKVKNIKLKQRLVKEKQAQVAEMKDSDAKRVSKQTKRNSGYIGAALWSIWSFFDDRVEFLMFIEDTIGHDTLMNLILLVLPVFIYDALNKYAFSRFKQQGKINMLLMPLLIGVGDTGYQQRKSKAMADITELENEITADLGKLVADKVLR